MISRLLSTVLTRVRGTPDEAESSSSWELAAPAGGAATATQAEEPAEPFGTGLAFKLAAQVPELALTPIQQKNLIEAETFEELQLFHFEPLDSLAEDPEFDSVLEGRGYLARAIRAGVGARSKLDGLRRTTVKSVRVPGKKRWYVVLRARDYPEGLLTQSFDTYRTAVQDHRTLQGFDPASVSHSFTRLAEVTAFLAGAQCQWPPEA